MISLPCKKPELYKYSPHQGRMLLLDQIDNFNMEESILESTVYVNMNSEFYNKETSYIPIWVSFEYMAQSIAVLSGINHKSNNDTPKIGFIISIRDFTSKRPGYKQGDEIHITVRQTFREGDLAVFEGATSVNGVLCSTAALSVIENNPELIERWKSDK